MLDEFKYKVEVTINQDAWESEEIDPATLFWMGQLFDRQQAKKTGPFTHIIVFKQEQDAKTLIEKLSNSPLQPISVTYTPPE